MTLSRPGFRLSGPAAILLIAGAASAQQCEWSALGSAPPGGGATNNVNALAVVDGALYIGGAFGSAGGLAGTSRLARWDGESWSAVGSAAGPALDGHIYALLAFDDALYVGGAFTSAGGVAGTSRIARWDPFTGTWSPLASGVDGTVFALTAFDGSLYAAGAFGNAGSLIANRVARWNPATGTWSRLGIGITGSVYALAAFEGEVYAAGFFIAAGGGPADNIARWNPATQLWSPLGAGVDSTVRALAIFDDGDPLGPALYVAGGFTSAGGLPAGYIAKWDGASWSTPNAFFDNFVFALAVSGSELYAGGAFASINGIPASRIARWDPVAGWLPLDGGIGGGDVFALGFFDADLHIGGSFNAAGGIPANRIARYICDPMIPPCYANCDGSTGEPILTVDDFTCFINEFAAAQALPHEQQISHYANCDGSTTAPVLTVDDFTCFIDSFAQGCR